LAHNLPTLTLQLITVINTTAKPTKQISGFAFETKNNLKLDHVVVYNFGGLNVTFYLIQQLEQRRPKIF